MPGGRHEKTHRMQRIKSAHQEHLEHVVEALRVGAGQRHERQNVVKVRQQRRAKQRSPRHRPVAVALNRIDLAVVGKVAVRVRQAPLRQGVGRKALVEDDQRGFEPRVVQIRKENGEILRHDHRFEDERRRRETWNIEVRIVRLESLFGATSHEEELAIEGGFIQIGGRAIDEYLLDVRQGLLRLGAAGVGVCGHFAPAADLESLMLQLHHHSAACRFGTRRIAA